MFLEFYKVILFLLQSIKLPINYPFGGSSLNLGCSHIFKIMTSSDFFGNENIFLLISLLNCFGQYHPNILESAKNLILSEKKI